MSIHFFLEKNNQVTKVQILCLINKDIKIYSLGRNMQDYSLTKHSEMRFVINSSFIAFLENLETPIISFFTHPKRVSKSP